MALPMFAYVKVLKCTPPGARSVRLAGLLALSLSAAFPFHRNSGSAYQRLSEITVAGTACAFTQFPFHFALKQNTSVQRCVYFLIFLGAFSCRPFKSSAQGCAGCGLRWLPLVASSSGGKRPAPPSCRLDPGRGRLRGYGKCEPIQKHIFRKRFSG